METVKETEMEAQAETETAVEAQAEAETVVETQAEMEVQEGSGTGNSAVQTGDSSKPVCICGNITPCSGSVRIRIQKKKSGKIILMPKAFGQSE